jgi:glucosyl-3-phosphoglycerate synthase
MTSFTFAVIGRDEAPYLPAALRAVREAAGPGDGVIYVDGSSTDGSPEIAHAHGVEVLRAPPGKGRAVDLALRSADGDYVCFFDADLHSSERNIARLLRDTVEAERPAMLIAETHEPARKLRVARTIYPTLVGALFPEVAGVAAVDPMSGFRAVARGVDTGRIPTGYGVETHLNVRLVMEGMRVASVRAGEYRGPLRGYASARAISADVTAATLDAAEAYGRLAAAQRPSWEAWTAPMIELARQAGRDPSRWREITDRATELAARPLPATRRSPRATRTGR